MSYEEIRRRLDTAEAKARETEAIALTAKCSVCWSSVGQRCCYWDWQRQRLIEHEPHMRRINLARQMPK